LEKLGKILIRKNVTQYHDGKELILESTERLIVDGKEIYMNDDHPISLTDGLKALGLAHTTELYYNENN